MAGISRRSWMIVTPVVLVVIAAAVILGIKLSTPIVPGAIKKQVSIVILYPSSDGFKVEAGSWKYNSSLGLLSYLVSRGNTKLTISEQSSPPEFSEVPGTLDRLTSHLNTYSDFDTIQGHAYLTHPIELKGGQSALMNTKGTLLFAKPNHALSDSEWRDFFNSLDIIR